MARQAAKLQTSQQPEELLDLGTWWDSPTRRTASTLQPRGWLTKTKFTLPAFGALLLLIAFIWPTFLPDVPDVKKALEKLRPGVVEELAMFDLNYKGTNKEGTPFAVDAVKAVRTGGEEEHPTIALTAPEADMQTKDGNKVEVKSETGVYDEKAQALQMQGGVEIQHDNGTTFNAPFLDVDFATNTARTTQPVTVHGDFGKISAPGMVLEDGGDRVIFTGTPDDRAHATINSAPKNGLTPVPTTAETDAAPLHEPLAEPKIPTAID